MKDFMLNAVDDMEEDWNMNISLEQENKTT